MAEEIVADRHQRRQETALRNLAEATEWLKSLRGGDVGAHMEPDAPNWEGAGGRSEHRTVGSHRAWCYDCREWCYPDELCKCCDDTRVPDKWRGEKVGAVLADLRRQIDAERQATLRNSISVVGKEVPSGVDPMATALTTRAVTLFWVLNLIETGGGNE